MNDRQSNTRRMWTVVDSVLTQYNAAWTPRLPFRKAVDDFRAALADFDAAALIEGRDTSGTVDDRDALEEAAARKADYIGDIIQAYALDQNNMELYHSMMFSAATIIHMRPEAAISKMKEVVEKATDLGDALNDYGIVADDVLGLQTAIQKFAEKSPEPRLNVGEKKVARKGIAGAVSRGNAALYRMDKQIATFGAAAPDFVGQFKSARVIVDAGGGGGDAPQTFPGS